MAEEFQFPGSIPQMLRAASPKTSVPTMQSEDLCMFNVPDMVNAILAVGDAVHVPQGSGTIQFIGPTSFAPGEWVGVVLHESNGKNDGSVRGERYFACSPGHGVFVRRSTCSPDDGRGEPLFQQGLASWPLAQPSPQTNEETGSRIKKKVKISQRKQDGTVSCPDVMGFAKQSGSLQLPPAIALSRERSPRSSGSNETLMPEASGASFMASADAASASTAQRTLKASASMEDFQKHGSNKLLREPFSEANEVNISAQMRLAEATEEQDVEQLRSTLPWAASLGVAHKDLEAARQVLHFKASHVYLHEVQNIESVMDSLSRVAHTTPLSQVIQTENSRRSNLSGKCRPTYLSQKSRPLAEEVSQEAAQTVEERVAKEVRSACTAALRTTCDDMRRSFAGFVRELRQDLFEIRNELNSVIDGLTREGGSKQNIEAEAINSKKNFKTMSQSSMDSRPSTAPTRANVQSTLSQLTLPDSGSEDDMPEIAAPASDQLRSILRRSSQRRDARRQQAAISTIKRCVRNLKGRWEQHDDTARSWQAVAYAARTRHAAVRSIFDRCRRENDGLVKEAFLRAMSTASPRLTERQSAALFDAFSKRTHRIQVDFRAFSSMCDAVASGDRAKIEFAGLNVEEFQDLAHK